ncbi:hypothetical protein BGX26_010954 [Mortierella sp. AD094]|nr:hypothetical protein BGX26_010954 [Mortierella sp. AD094]
MIPPKRATATTKRTSSHNAQNEPSTKRNRPSKTKNKAAPKQQVKEEEEELDDNDIKAEPSEDATQVNNSSKTSTTQERGSPNAETKKTEPDDDHIKTEEAELAKPEREIKSESQNEGENGQRVIEKGNAFFFYRPKIDVDKPSSTQDIQKLYMLLSPDDAAGDSATKDKSGHGNSPSKPSHAGQPRHRLLIIPQKSLPSPGKGRQSRAWAFVGEASTDLGEVEGKLERYTYSTKTHGKRTQESARLIAEVRYNILLDEKNHSHFVYELEVPQQPGDVQQEFNILKEGQFLVQVKNPEIQTAATERGQARYATLGEGAAKLPKHLQEKFRGIRKEWVRHTNLDSVEFLDIRHVEVVLIAVNKDAKEEFEEVMRALEAEVEENEIDSENPEDQVYKELNLEEDKVPSAIEEFK